MAVTLQDRQPTSIVKVFVFYWSREEIILHHSAAADGGDDFAFPSAEGEIVVLEVSVAGLYLLEEAALWAFFVSEDFVGAYVIGKDGEEKTVSAVFAEKVAETVEVGAKEEVGFGNGEVASEVFGGLDLVAPTDVGIVLADVVPAFVVLYHSHSAFVVR